MTKKINIWSRKKLLILAVPLLLSVFGSLIIIVFKPSLAAGTGNLSLIPSNVNVSTGNTFTITGRLAVSPGAQVNAVSLKLNYDTSKLEITSGPNWSIACQGFPPYDPSNPSITWPVDFGGSKFYPLNCLSNNTTDVFNVTFRAKAAGTSTITLDGSSLISGDSSNQLTPSFTGSSVNAVDNVSSVNVSTSKNRVMQSTSNYVLITAKAVNAAGVGITGKQVSVTGIRTGDTITPSNATTNANGEIVYTYKSTVLGTTTLTFTSDGKTATQIIQTVKTGDITGSQGNSDGKIDIFDAAALMAGWSTNVTNSSYSDINCDGKIDVLDAAIVIANWTG